MRARLPGLFLLLCLSASAIDLKSLKPQGYVSDFAGVVDPESRAAIDAYAAAVEQATGAQMSFVTLKTLGGDNLEDVSIDLFRQFGVGQKNKDNGVQLLLVVDDRRSRLEIGNALESVLPDGFDGQLLLDMRPELQAGHYGRAILGAAQSIGGTIAQAQGKSIAAPPATRAVAPHEHPDDFPWLPVVFVIVIVVLSLFRRRPGGGGGFWTGLILGNLISGGWGRGGGFGGFHDGGNSSGGFGGFGGGDAGGGGASSSW